nr:ferric anguibactin-binding protein [Vibrio breoganii]
MGTIEINQTPKRVVVLGHGSLDILDELAVKPVGVVKPLLPHFISQYAGNEYETVGSLKEPNFESIYMLKPDIIIAEGRQAAMYKELSQIAPTYLFQIDNKDYWKTTQHHWRVLGDIFDKQNIAESLIKNTDERMQNVHILASKENLRTLAVMNNGNNLAMYGEQSRFSIIFEDFGFKSASAPSTKPTDPHGNLISFEYIAQAKPDAMIILDREQAIGTSNGRAQALFDNALVHSTPAYKHEKMVFMDPAAWYLSAGGYKATHIMIDDVESVL